MADTPKFIAATESPHLRAPSARRLPRVEPALQVPLLSALGGILSAAGLAFVLPAGLALPLSLLALGLGSLSAVIALDAHRRREMDALSRNLGELNVRLGATRVKLDGLRSRLDSEPLREADIAPTRTSLAELSAEVGLLGGVLRDVANAVAEHETKLSAGEDAAKPALPRTTAPLGRPDSFAATSGPANQAGTGAVAGAGSLVAETDEVADANFRRREDDRLASIMEAFSQGGLEIHLQPIATLPQRKTIGYEALARLRLKDGSLLLPAEFIAALERSGHGSALDAQVLTQVLTIAGHVNAKGQDHFVSLNLSAGTWSEARALGAVAKVLETFREQATRIVIDIPQRTWRVLDPAKFGIVGAMAANGVRFAIDQVSDLRIDPAALSDRGVCFLKTPASVLSTLSQQTSGLDIAAGDLALLLRRFGIELIGEKAETDRMVADLIDLDVRLAQGFAISQPRPVRPEVFLAPVQQGDSQERTEEGNEAAAAKGEATVGGASSRPGPQPEAERDPGMDRVPFRAVLRRA